MLTSEGKYILCKSLVSEFFWERIPFDGQCLSVTPLKFCVTVFVNAINQNVSIVCGKFFCVAL